MANPYDTLKAALIKAFGKTQAEKDQELLSLNSLGDKKLSELLQHMKNLNAELATLFKALFLAQLPPVVRRILATSSKTDIAELASEADRIMEVTRLTHDAQVNAASTVHGLTQRNQPGELCTGPGRSGTPMTRLPGLCKYQTSEIRQVNAHFQPESGNKQAGWQ